MTDKGNMQNARGPAREFPPLRRRGIQRLAYERWGAGRSVWETERGDRGLEVDQVEVYEGAASENAARTLGLEAGESACIRSRRFVLDGKPVMLGYVVPPRVPGRRCLARADHSAGHGGPAADRDRGRCPPELNRRHLGGQADVPGGGPRQPCPPVPAGRWRRPSRRLTTWSWSVVSVAYAVVVVRLSASASAPPSRRAFRALSRADLEEHHRDGRQIGRAVGEGGAELLRARRPRPGVAS
ncbi:hypothetical protein SMICM304S_06414 [Streptomyces microflavus]